MVSIVDVARRAGVSMSTAKRAVQNPELLKPGTLEKVRAAIEELDYEPDFRAGALRGGHTKIVGLIVGSIVEPFFAELARLISRRLHAAGYSVAISENEYRSDLELDSLRQLRRQRVSAVVVRPGYGGSTLDYLEKMQADGTLIIEVDNSQADGRFSSVLLDNEQAVRLGLQHLIGLGHRRIAAIGTYDPIQQREERSRYFVEIMREHGLDVDPAFQQIILYTQEAAFDYTMSVMQLEKPPTAIFAFNDTEAVGALQAIQALGLKVGQDVSLLTFDNYPWTSLTSPGIDALEQPVSSMGNAVSDMVISGLEGRGPEAPVHLRFPAELIKRGSSIHL